jgi:hypothetical protein
MAANAIRKAIIVAPVRGWGRLRLFFDGKLADLAMPPDTQLRNRDARQKIYITADGMTYSARGCTWIANPSQVPWTENQETPRYVLRLCR